MIVCLDRTNHDKYSECEDKSGRPWSRFSALGLVLWFVDLVRQTIPPYSLAHPGSRLPAERFGPFLHFAMQPLELADDSARSRFLQVVGSHVDALGNAIGQRAIPTPVVAAKVEDIVFPSDYVYYSKSMGWRKIAFFPEGPDAKIYKGVRLAYLCH